MRLALLADFWPWFNHLQDSEKIAYWAMLVSIATALVGVIVGFVAALYGAKYGAKAAFNLGQTQQKRDLEDKRYGSLIATQYALFSQLNILENIRVGFLEAHRDNPQNFLNLPIYHMADTAYRLSIADISFIAESEGSNLLQEIHVAEQTYVAAMESLARFREQQEKFYRNPSITYEEFNFETGKSKITASPVEVYPLKASAIGMYKLFDRSLPLLNDCIPKVGAYIKTHFPNRLRIIVTPIDKASDSAANCKDGLPSDATVNKG